MEALECIQNYLKQGKSNLDSLCELESEIKTLKICINQYIDHYVISRIDILRVSAAKKYVRQQYFHVERDETSQSSKSWHETARRDESSSSDV